MKTNKNCIKQKKKFKHINFKNLEIKIINNKELIFYQNKQITIVTQVII